MPSTNRFSNGGEPPDELEFEVEMQERCYHEAAHAVFAYHDGIHVSEVTVSPEGAPARYWMPTTMKNICPGVTPSSALQGPAPRA